MRPKACALRVFFTASHSIGKRLPTTETNGEKGVEQYAALCWRENGPDIEILLITSRDTGRWVIPRGWPMEGKTRAEAAAQEAWEEAGVKGQPHPVPVGVYQYWKPERASEIEVTVFSLRADKAAKDFPERKQRKRKWLPAREAAALVAEGGLAEMIRSFV